MTSQAVLGRSPIPLQQKFALNVAKEETGPLSLSLRSTGLSALCFKESLTFILRDHGSHVLRTWPATQKLSLSWSGVDHQHYCVHVRWTTLLNHRRSNTHAMPLNRHDTICKEHAILLMEIRRRESLDVVAGLQMIACFDFTPRAPLPITSAS